MDSEYFCAYFSQMIYFQEVIDIDDCVSGYCHYLVLVLSRHFGSIWNFTSSLSLSIHLILSLSLSVILQVLKHSSGLCNPAGETECQRK